MKLEIINLIFMHLYMVYVMEIYYIQKSLINLPNKEILNILEAKIDAIPIFNDDSPMTFLHFEDFQATIEDGKINQRL